MDQPSQSLLNVLSVRTRIVSYTLQRTIRLVYVRSNSAPTRDGTKLLNLMDTDAVTDLINASFIVTLLFNYIYKKEKKSGAVVVKNLKNPFATGVNAYVLFNFLCTYLPRPSPVKFLLSFT